MTSRVLLGERLLTASAGTGAILGLDTGGPVAGIGVVAAGRIVASFSRPLPSHCAGLPAAVAEALMAAGLGMADLAGIAVGHGPGSFTGLRVGLSYAKGLAAAAGIALAGVPSLDAIALAAVSEMDADGLLCPVLDARRGEVYAALYRFSGDALEKLSDDLALPATALAALITEPVTVIGESMAVAVAALVNRDGGRADAVGSASSRGGCVGILGALRLAASAGDDIATLEPRYVRPAGATIDSALRRGERVLWNVERKS